MQTETPLITVKRHHKAMVEMTKDKNLYVSLHKCFNLTLTGPQILKSRQKTCTTSDLNQTADGWNVLLYKSQVSSNKISHSFSHIDKYNQTYISMKKQSLYSGCLFEPMSSKKKLKQQFKSMSSSMTVHPVYLHWMHSINK